MPDHAPPHLRPDLRPDLRSVPLDVRDGRVRPEPGALLLVTRDATLGEDLDRLAAAAGVSIRVVGEPDVALASWASAPAVLVGADLAETVADLRPARRPGVHVVGWGGQPDATYRSALELGAEHVLELPAAAELLTDALTDLGESATGGTVVVGVLAGSGGAGATTLACALGQQRGRVGPTLVVDLDPWGPGADLVLGLDQSPGVRWDDLAGSVGRLGGRSLREAVPRRDGVGVLSFTTGRVVAPEPAVVREALSAAVRGHDTVVVDLARPGDPWGVEVQARCGLVVLVVQPTLTGVAAAARAADRVVDPARLGVVVRQGRGRTADPARVAAVVGAPLLATLPDQRGLAEALDLGLGPGRSSRGPLARACRRVLAA